MICLFCDCEEFARVERARIEQEIRGEIVTFWSPAMACKQCGWMALDGKCYTDLLIEFRKWKEKNQSPD